MQRLVRRGRERVLDVLLEVPGRLPRRVAVPPQVERQHVEAVGEPLGEAAEVAAVARHAVQADERRRAGVAPLVDGDRHSARRRRRDRRRAPRDAYRSSFTSVQTTLPSLSIRNVPRTGAPRRLVEHAVGLATRRRAARSRRRACTSGRARFFHAWRVGRRVARDEDDVRVGVLERVEVLLEIARLLLADRRERERVEDEQDVAAAAEVASRTRSSRRPSGRSQAPRPHLDRRPLGHRPPPPRRFPKGDSTAVRAALPGGSRARSRAGRRAGRRSPRRGRASSRRVVRVAQHRRRTQVAALPHVLARLPDRERARVRLRRAGEVDRGLREVQLRLRAGRRARAPARRRRRPAAPAGRRCRRPRRRGSTIRRAMKRGSSPPSSIAAR